MTNNQSTSHILMVRPVNFGFNEETAASNAFQNRNSAKGGVNEKAQHEFDAMVALLRQNGVDVTVVDDTAEPHTPDAVFPNNWVSFHADGSVFLYPMQAPNRRPERRQDIIEQLKKHFAVKHIVNLSYFEQQNKFLEGTGSMVPDRENKIIYACLSPRTNSDVLASFCEKAHYKAIIFNAADEHHNPIYHTNVLMCVGSKFAVICLDSIADKHEKKLVVASLTATSKQIIEISFKQMNHFAGNMLEVKNNKDETLIVMSRSAYEVLNENQKTTLQKYGKLVYADINTIETNGGGSARCMMAEVHLPVDGR